MKVVYNNPLVNSEEILKYLVKNHKIRYWVTLKLPYFMRTKEYTIDVVINNVFNPFIKNVTELANDKNLFILGVIEDYYLKDGFHAHVLIATSKEQHIIRHSWITAIQYACKELGQKEKIYKMIMDSDSKSSLTWMDDLRIKQKPLINLIKYMFKNYGLNKGHGYFCNKNDIELRKWIETQEYKEFLKLKMNNNISFVIFIYALADMFKYKLSFKFYLEIIQEKQEIIKEILKCIDEYVIENTEFLFEHEHSSERLNDLIKQISIELTNSEFLFILKGNYSYLKKEDIYEKFIKLLQEKKRGTISYYDYLFDFFKKGFDDYLNYINQNLDRSKTVKYITNYEKWAEGLSVEMYIFDIISCCIDWINVQMSLANNKTPFSQEFIIKEFQKIWDYYINSFTLKKIEKLDLKIEDYFIIFQILCSSIEKSMNMRLSLLTEVKVLNKEDKLRSYVVWSTTKSRKLKDKIKLLIEKTNNITQNFNFVDLKKIAVNKLLLGTLFIKPKKWSYDGNKNLNENYTGGYILNKVFKISSLLHHDEAWIGKFEPDNYEEFINILNKYQEQSYKVNYKEVGAYEEESYESVKDNNISNIYNIDNNKYIDNDIDTYPIYNNKYINLEKEERMKKIREDVKERWKKEIKEKEIWNVIYIDGRGRIYITGIHNYQNDKEVRYKMITSSNLVRPTVLKT